MLDVNDPPRFAQNNITIGTSEVNDVTMTSSNLEPTDSIVINMLQQGTQIGTIIARFVAVDEDLSSNGVLVYSLRQTSPNGAASFSIHPLTGDLMVILSLNLNTVYEIRVTATVCRIASQCNTVEPLI